MFKGSAKSKVIASVKNNVLDVSKALRISQDETGVVDGF